MAKVVKFDDMIKYDGVDFPIRTITIFKGTDEESTINVSTQTLGDLIVANEDEDCGVDECIACYVEDILFYTMSTRQLTKHVQENYYN